MVNARFVKSVTDYWTPQFYQMVKHIQKGRPPGTTLPPAAIVPPRERLADSEIPFVAGDRVQITRGADKGKVCRIVMRYPGFGNAFLVAGAGFESDMVNVVEAKEAEAEPENWEPLTRIYKTFDYKDMRLVSKIRGENGDEDVAIHSVKLGREVYDPASNKYLRERYAAHDPSIVIPWPVETVKEVETDLTTNSVAADTRTHFVTSATECPIPQGAIDQITNVHNRYKRGRYAPRVTEEDLAKIRPPPMRLNPKTVKMLEEIKSMPQPEKVEFTEEIESFIAREIKSGLQKRREQHEPARQSS